MEDIDLSTSCVADELHEDNYAPKQLSMRKHLTKKSGRTGRYEYMWPDGAYTKQGRLRRYVPRLIEKNIGRSFDAVFSKFCSQYPEYIGTTNTRELFKEHFYEYSDERSRRWKYIDFCIDKQGRIAHIDKDKKKYKNSNLEFYTDEPETYYILNRPLLKKYPELDNCIYQLIGKKIYNYITMEDKINVKVYHKIDNILKNSVNREKLLRSIGYNDENYHPGYYNEYAYIVDGIFIRKCDTPTIELKKGSDGYVQYQKEKSDKAKRRARERQIERQEQYEALLRQLWEQQQKDKAEDIITRDRLGFDNMSFRKEKEE